MFFTPEKLPRASLERKERMPSFCCLLVCPSTEGSPSLHLLGGLICATKWGAGTGADGECDVAYTSR